MGAVNGTNNADFIFATLGDDTISAYGGDDTILARAGDDEIKGGGGADAINGGAGSDTAFYSDSTVGVWVSLLTGTGSGAPRRATP
jgi:Ca2+-binding RTX toxin-like protein